MVSNHGPASQIGPRYRSPVVTRDLRRPRCAKARPGCKRHRQASRVPGGRWSENVRVSLETWKEMVPRLARLDVRKADVGAGDKPGVIVLAKLPFLLGHLPFDCLVSRRRRLSWQCRLGGLQTNSRRGNFPAAHHAERSQSGQDRLPSALRIPLPSNAECQSVGRFAPQSRKGHRHLAKVSWSTRPS